MSAISAKLVMELRDSTNLPMMKCKQALEASNGDMAAAIEWLRKQGIAAVGKFLDRETPNGSIGMAVGTGAGVLVLLGCQTDFVAINEDFKADAKKIAEACLAAGADSVESAKAAKLGAGTVGDAVTDLVNRIRENIVLAKVVRITGQEVVGYNHGGKVAALVAGSNNADNKLKQVALHVASANPEPVALDRSGVDQTLVDKEREILLATPEVQGKPEAMRPKIVEGKLGRFYKERVLIEQEMMLDNEKGESVEKYAKRVGISITGFARVSV